jgi:hypothetical protein
VRWAKEKNMPNQHVLQRLHGIQTQLIGIHQSGVLMSSASKGTERQEFIDKFLSQVLPNNFRFGTGDATDRNGNKSGQLDVVIEYPFGPSLPIVGGATTRLYLAETVAAVVEVKSDVSSQWEQAVSTAKQLQSLNRSYGTTMLMGPNLPKIPLFVASYAGWNQMATLLQKLSETPEISGILVINTGLFAASPIFGGIQATGPWSLWGFISCLHQATSFLKAATTNPLDYAK